MPGPRSEYGEEQLLLIQQLRQNKIAWPEVRRLFNETYPEKKWSEDALCKVHSCTLSLPTSSSKSAQPPKTIQFAAIHTPADPPSLSRSHESTATQQPCRLLVWAQLSQVTINQRPSENRVVKQLSFYYRYVCGIYMDSTLLQWSDGASRGYDP